MHGEVYGVLQISTTSPPPHSAGCNTCLLLVSASVTALAVYALMVLIVSLVLMVFPVPTSTTTEVYKIVMQHNLLHRVVLAVVVVLLIAFIVHDSSHI